MFNTIEESLDWLYNQKKISPRQDLHRITLCAKELALEPKYKIVHIAGTNGKGSTASYIKHILRHTGKKIGMFVSPYVICFNERIQMNERFISNAEILYYTNELYGYSKSYYERYQDIIPFFELTLLMALMYFRDRKIDLAIIECGLGGLLDATNFLKTDLAIITNIGYDHMATLGNTLEEIAQHKLGIIKDDMICLTAVDEKLKPLFIEYGNKKNTNFHFVYPDVKNISIDNSTKFQYKNVEYQTSLLGKYQAYNAALAIEAVQILEPDIPYELIQVGLSETKWPGRMEVLNSNPLILLDGAHNIPGIEALVDSIKEIKKDKKIKIIFSALQDKAFDQMLTILDSVSDFYYFTSIVDTRATSPKEFAKYTKKNFEIVMDYKECLKKAIFDLNEDEILLITGSLHFISLIREAYYNLK